MCCAPPRLALARLFSRARDFLTACAALSLAIGCTQQTGNGSSDARAQSTGPLIRAVNLNDPVRPVPQEGPIALVAAKNEWVNFAVQVDQLPRPTARQSYRIRLHPFRAPGAGADAIPSEQFTAFQAVELPVNVNRAGYVRHTGLSVADRALPRALIPLSLEKGAIDLRSLRSGRDPANPRSRAVDTPREPVLLWVDVQIPPQTPPGEYVTRCELVESRRAEPLASATIRLTVHDFVMPDERHLQIVSRLEWDDLQRLFPAEFEAVRPQLLSRDDPASAATIRTLDQLVTLAQRNRAAVIVPRLQPLVKWTSVEPSVTWDGLDTLIAPWLNGDVFADRTPLGYWPMPAPDFLASYDLKSRLAYWSAAASHFSQNQWLSRSSVIVNKASPGRAGASESVQISADAAQILAVDPALRVTLPLEDDQLHFAGEHNPNLVDPRATPRIIAEAPGLVFASPLQPWPEGVQRPQRWLSADASGLNPYMGAGADERDVRLWAWLAFLRNATIIQWDSSLPRTTGPMEPAEPGNIVWFYPGQWFGLSEPVPTVQLKWLRRAQQDYEYLWLSRQRGEYINALLLARLITKQVEIQPNQLADPVYALLCGMTDPPAWVEAQQLLAQSILLREPGQEPDKHKRQELNLRMLRWAEAQERPVLLARTTQWLFDSPDPRQPGHWLSLRLGIDIYNASDKPLDQNTLRWSSVPNPFEIRPQATSIDSLATYRVHRVAMDARYNLERLSGRDRRPIELTFTDGYYKRNSTLRLVLPVAPCERRRPGLDINGKLDDWDANDLAHDGPLTRMVNRPALHRGEVQPADTTTRLYTGWADENLYLAFHLAGVSAAELRAARNYVDYQQRRAWGEDLCQLLIQPVYDDNTLGPVFNMVCKPTGSVSLERKTDPRQSINPWQPIEGAGVRYECTIDAGDWRGEMRIPWKAIADPDKPRPRLLRFNFSQHKHATGESASWAGPIDFGRDDSFTGVLYLRESDEPGMAK